MTYWPLLHVDVHCWKQVGWHCVYSVLHQYKDAGGSSLTSCKAWPFVNRFHCHCPRCNDNVSAGVWNVRLPSRQELVLWGETDPVFHYWQYTLLIKHFSLRVWSSYFHGKHHEISAALWNCLSCPIAPRCFIGASGRKKVGGIPKLYLSCFERLASNLGKLNTGAEGSQHIHRTGISFCLLGDSDVPLAVS